MVKKFFVTLAAILVIAYPLIVYFGLTVLSLRYVALILMFIFVLRLIALNQAKQAKQAKKNKSMMQIIAVLFVLLGLIVCIFALMLDSDKAIRLYPVLISLLLFCLFFYSWIVPPTMIERFAHLLDKRPFPKEAITYMRKVTLVWCLFFIVNTLFALMTALWASIQIWTLYNGMISYILIGLIFIIEYAIRIRVKRRIKKD